jgi:hypothetical protein
MSTTFTWKVSDLERTTADGKVNVVHYTVTAEDGTYSSGAYGSLGFDGDVTTPYADLTEEVVVGWVKEQFGVEKISEIEEALQNQLDEQAQPTKANGTPWS